MLTMSHLLSIYPKATKEHLEKIKEKNVSLFKKYNIDEMWQVCYLLAQIHHESAGLTTLVENLNYSAKRLMQVWPKRFRSSDIANKYAKNPERLANYVYSSRMGNGGEESGDGYKYRGRGYIQLTGKCNYDRIGKFIGLDLIENPDFACDPEYGLEVVLGFWKVNNLDKVSDFTRLTRLINGGVHGLVDRNKQLARIKNVLAVNEDKSSKDTDIATLQRLINEKFFWDLTIDGRTGPKTKSGIKNVLDVLNIQESDIYFNLLNTNIKVQVVELLNKKNFSVTDLRDSIISHAIEAYKQNTGFSEIDPKITKELMISLEK